MIDTNIDPAARNVLRLYVKDGAAFVFINGARLFNVAELRQFIGSDGTMQAQITIPIRFGTGLPSAEDDVLRRSGGS